MSNPVRGIARDPVILVVEDSPADLRLAQEVLREAAIGESLQIARDGEQALRMLRREGEWAALPLPDLVLLDLHLPRKDGHQVLREIKADPGLCHIPVLMLSTSNAESDVLGCYRAHANCYLTKPADIADFSRLARLIRDFWLRIAQLPPVPTLT